MTAIAKSVKPHPAAKKCCGWEEPAICKCGHKAPDVPAVIPPVSMMVSI